MRLVFIYNMPIRGFSKISGGRISYRMSRSIVTIVNGHAAAFFKGMGGLISGYFSQRRVRRNAAKIK